MLRSVLFHFCRKCWRNPQRCEQQMVEATAREVVYVGN
jgi:hypothetical protein